MKKNFVIEDIVFTIKTVDSWYGINFNVDKKTYYGFRFLNEAFSEREELDEFTCTRMFRSIMNFFKGVK